MPHSPVAWFCSRQQKTLVSTSNKIVSNNFMTHGMIGAPDTRRSQVRRQGRTWWLSKTISKMGNFSWLVIGIVSIEKLFGIMVGCEI